jgi:hypothetical protein
LLSVAALQVTVGVRLLVSAEGPVIENAAGGVLSLVYVTKLTQLELFPAKSVALPYIVVEVSAATSPVIVAGPPPTNFG